MLWPNDVIFCDIIIECITFTCYVLLCSLLIIYCGIVIGMTTSYFVDVIIVVFMMILILFLLIMLLWPTTSVVRVIHFVRYFVVNNFGPVMDDYCYYCILIGASIDIRNDCCCV